jgi:hypothetical protein
MIVISGFCNLFSSSFLLRLVGAKHQIGAVGCDAKLVRKGFVQRCLPPCFSCKHGPFQTSAFHLGAVDVEQAHLLSFKRSKALRALNGQKGAIVGVQRGAYVQVLHIIGQQTDVAQCVVFAFARGSYVGYLSCAALHTEAGGLGHVVIVLLVFQMQEVCILLFQRLLTSSSCHPKFFIKEFGDFLMPCHQHGLGVNLLVQR